VCSDPLIETFRALIVWVAAVRHSSRENLSEERRWGYATHFVSAHCRYTGEEGTNDAILVRGDSQEGCI